MTIRSPSMLTVFIMPPITSVLWQQVPIMNDPSCLCDAKFAPVCGTDGNTYTNACVLRCAESHLAIKPVQSIEIMRPGACTKNVCHCIPYVDYVCGSDQYTYINRCYLRCHNKRVENLQLPITVEAVSAEQCKNINYCINDVVPVCGTNSKTYRNLCFLQYASHQNMRNDLPLIYLSYWGPCHVEVCPCPLQVDPVCGSNGREYSNYCIFNCERRRRVQLNLGPLMLENAGPCPDNCKCPDSVTPDDAICGSDSKTYPSRCHLHCANNKRAIQSLPPVTVIGEYSCDCSCSAEDYNSVCASDYKTYQNPCEVECANDIRKMLNLTALKHLSNEECETCTCSHYYVDPVCSSDGRNFNNHCLLICENRQREMQGLPQLEYKRGPCEHEWNYVYDPVCANSDELSNPCLLFSDPVTASTTENYFTINT